MVALLRAYLGHLKTLLVTPINLQVELLNPKPDDLSFFGSSRGIGCLNPQP